MSSTVSLPAGVSFPDYSDPLVVFGSRGYERTGSARENGEQLVSDLEEAGIQFDAIVSGGARGADRAGEVAGVLTDTPVVVFNVNGVDDRHHWYADHSDAHYQVETVSAVGVADARVEVEEAHEAEDADNDDGGDDDVHDVEEDDNDDTVVGVESDERGTPATTTTRGTIEQTMGRTLKQPTGWESMEMVMVVEMPGRSASASGVWGETLGEMEEPGETGMSAVVVMAARLLLLLIQRLLLVTALIKEISPPRSRSAGYRAL
ncbi:hypothetical protein [Halonotius sp. GCM10025705]|uniref:hypothetical protein n=1 Tax=Halonotius sp. GCM10025705 TaxID=3252678 RepID=UPI003608A5BB